MPNEPRAAILVSDSEEPIQVLIIGHVLDDDAKKIARRAMKDEAFDDIEQTLERSAMVRRHSRWVKAPEGSPQDEILETCDAGDEGAFASTHVLFP